MTENLTLPLSAGVAVVAASNTSATSMSFTPTSCGTNGTCPINGNTRSANGTYFYSWYAATAGTGTSSQIDTDTSASICPVGWRLPVNYSISQSKSYGLVTDSYGLTINGERNNQNHVSELESFPFNFSRYGFYENGASSNRSVYGLGWSSTAADDTSYAYYFVYGSPETVPQSSSRKQIGMNIRCVAL